MEVPFHWVYPGLIIMTKTKLRQVAANDINTWTVNDVPLLYTLGKLYCYHKKLREARQENSEF